VLGISADTLYLCYCIDRETGDRRRAEVFELVRFWTPIPFTYVWLTITPEQFEYNSRPPQQQPQRQQRQQQTARVNRPQPPPAPTPHAPQPISQRVEGIMSPESSPELSPTGFQLDLEVGRRQHRPAPPMQPQQPVAQALQRQESSEMDPFLPDLDSEPEPEPEQVERVGVARVMGYDVDDPNPALAGLYSDDEEVEEGMTTSALLPGSDIF
jgi:hypothetical protein